jgi:hypothetical protein
VVKGFELPYCTGGTILLQVKYLKENKRSFLLIKDPCDPTIVKCRDKNHVLLTRFLPNLDDTDSLLNKSSTVIMVVLYRSLDIINLSLSLLNKDQFFVVKQADLAKK